MLRLRLMLCWLRLQWLLLLLLQWRMRGMLLRLRVNLSWWLLWLLLQRALRLRLWLASMLKPLVLLMLLVQRRLVMDRIGCPLVIVQCLLLGVLRLQWRLLTWLRLQGHLILRMMGWPWCHLLHMMCVCRLAVDMIFLSSLSKLDMLRVVYRMCR